LGVDIDGGRGLDPGCYPAFGRRVERGGFDLSVTNLFGGAVNIIIIIVLI